MPHLIPLAPGEIHLWLSFYEETDVDLHAAYRRLLDFHYSDDHSVEINIDPDLGDNAARWQFWQFRPSPEYLAAVCGERVGMLCGVVVRRTVPMQDDNEFAADFLRISS